MITQEIRYTYARLMTRERALEVIEDMFADGRVSSSENPRVKFKGGMYLVTLKDINLSAYL